MRLFHLGPDPHREVRELIPWVVNGRATAAQAAAVRDHVGQCAACREDYETEARLYGMMHEEGSVVFTAESSFQKLLARIDAAPEVSAAEHEPAPRTPVLAAAARSTRTVRYLAAAVIVQAAGLGLSAWLLHANSRQFEARYFTLTQPQTPDYTRGARVRVVFSPGMTLGALHRLLQSAGAHIINGPTESGVYTLGFAPGSAATESALDARVRLLRADSAVVFAEPLAPGAPP